MNRDPGPRRDDEQPGPGRAGVRRKRKTSMATKAAPAHRDPAHRVQAHPQDLRQHPRSLRNAEPDRGSARELRAVPPLAAAGRLCLRPGKDAALGLPDPRLRRHRRAGFRPLRARGSQVRRRRVPPARHDLCRADARHAAPDRVRGRSRHRDPLRPRYQGAGRLHGRHAADDEERHVHRQRHRARDRQPDAPLAGRAVRP